jgi:Transglycosylase SLT domain
MPTVTRPGGHRVRGGRLARNRAEGVAYGGLRVGRFAVRTPFKLAKKTFGLFSPKHGPKKLRRRVRRLLVISVLVLFLVFVVPTLMMVPQDDGLATLTPGLFSGLAAADACTTPSTPPATGPVATGEPTGLTDPESCAPSGGVGTVDGIPYAEVFNSTASLGIDPRLVAAVAYVESGNFAEDVIDCRRESSAGARGIMQLMPGTAASLDVDPCDP